jgi:hypothetical protein
MGLRIHIPLLLLVVDHGLGLIGCCNLNGLRPHRWVSINDGTRKIKMRRKDALRGEFAPKLACVWRTEHVPDFCHSVCDVKRELFQFSKKLVGEMFRAGVPLLAGTDTGNPYCFPGFSLHDDKSLRALSREPQLTSPLSEMLS